jgi:hypothetical protein
VDHLGLGKVHGYGKEPKKRGHAFFVMQYDRIGLYDRGDNFYLVNIAAENQH